ncbi:MULTISPECIES: hypothetical protein [Sorangium]|uniref:Secreted protein n=1 Tax=Sorangium cellulosum (strain So ce56) TaxID=448385 RepID=A9F911_SORC5|nr:hypothetical protein [Sorangium cellulosum]CAN94709.1 hypothetical protein predicted by Glimmer/Critica [Sorangium cellulosum So ce56]
MTSEAMGARGCSRGARGAPAGEGRGRARRARSALSLAAALAALAAPSVAAAQLGFGQPGMTQPPPASAPPKPPPGTPETHAAPTSEESPIQTQEPTLPEDPLAVPPAVKKQIGTNDVGEWERGRAAEIQRDWYGPYYSERSGSYQFRTLFPLWAERRMPGDRATMVTPLYYNRRSKDVDADVLFPFFWKLRDENTYTTIVGPFMHRESEGRPASPGRKAEPGRHDNWLAPLFFEGKRDDGSGYFHIPPLLTFTHHTAQSGFNLVGPLFCSWKGGPACDTRSADKIDLGLAPLYFYGHDESSEYEVIPPLLHYYHYSDVGDRSTNVWGPLMWQHSRKGDVFNVMPFYWHSWGKNYDRTTLFPFFHYGYEGNKSLLVTPLFLKARGEEGESTFATWGYARYRGRTELDMITPLFWQYRDPDIDLERTFLLPFYYRNTSPRSDDLVLFPFYGRFKRHGLSDTTWLTPLVRHTRDLTGWETDIYPFFYSGRNRDSTHLVVAPFLWDFASPTSRTTVALPFFFRFADPNSVTQVALNTVYREHRVRNGKEWEFHLVPLFSYGETPDGHWWNVLFGLAGYTRAGTAAKMRALYIPIQLSQ